MQDRLQEIMDKEHLTPARFAELIGVQRSSISHILSGRNNPSLEFLRKILLHLEHINPDWLISGKGPYKRNQEWSVNQKKTKQEPSAEKMNSGRIEFPEKSPVKDEDRVPYFQKKQENPSQKSHENPDNSDDPIASNETSPSNENGFMNKNEDPPTKPAHAVSRGKNIIKTVFFYDDQTFDVFYPSS